MFNNLKQMLINKHNEVSSQPTTDETPEMDHSSMDGDFNMDDPESVLNDPKAPFELKQEAIQLIKDRYLKPRDKNE